MPRRRDVPPSERIAALERQLEAKERECEMLRERVSLFAKLSAWGGRIPRSETSQ